MTKFWASDENFHRRNFLPTKIFTDEVFASKVYEKAIGSSLVLFIYFLIWNHYFIRKLQDIKQKSVTIFFFIPMKVANYKKKLNENKK